MAVTLAETDFTQAVSDRWIETGKELYVSAGYSCYCRLLGNRKDEEFGREKLNTILETVEKTIHSSPDRAKYAMNNFVISPKKTYFPSRGKYVFSYVQKSGIIRYRALYHME